jgi:hypothetical protein
MNITYTHADNTHKYYQTRSTLVTKEGRLQSSRLFATKVSIDYSFDAINRGLTQKDVFNFVMVLAQYIKSDSVLYVYDKGKRHKRPMTKNDMREILDLTKGSFNNFWARCIKANVLKIDKTISNNDITRQVIYVNPAFMQPNYSITAKAYWLFKNDLDAKLDDTTIAMYTDEFNRQYGTHTHEDAVTYLESEEAVKEENVTEIEVNYNPEELEADPDEVAEELTEDTVAPIKYNKPVNIVPLDDAKSTYEELAAKMRKKLLNNNVSNSRTLLNI